MPSPTMPPPCPLPALERSVHPRTSHRGRWRGLAGAAAVALALVPVLTACGESGEGSSGDSTGTTAEETSTTDPSQNPAAYTAYPDPSQPVVVALGKRFGLLVEVDPSAGRRRQVEGPLNTEILLPLGTELISDNPSLAGNPDTQVLMFVPQNLGTTSVTLVEVGPDGAPVPDSQPITFTIVVTADGQPPPPPPPPDPEDASAAD